MHRLEAWTEVALVSVKHTGTRFVRDHLVGWGIPVIQSHVDSPVSRRYPDQPSIIPIRDPFMSFLTHWKQVGNGRAEHVMIREFIAHWELLDDFLDWHKGPRIIFHVARESMVNLASLLNVEYKPVVDKGQSSHFICDKYIFPRRENFPLEIQAIATRWGY